MAERQVEFRILGPLEVVVDAQPHSLSGSRERTLLAALLLHPATVVARDELIAMVWGPEAPSSAVVSLHVGVSRLRARLSELGLARDVLETRPPGYVLNVAPEQVDLGRFRAGVAEARRLRQTEGPGSAGQRLRDALALWRGQPLVDGKLAPWSEGAASDLAEERLTALEERIECDLAIGHAAELAGELRALVAQHPFREHLHAQLMLALFRCGRQAEALEAFWAARRTLQEQLGLEPGPELRALQQAILVHDPALHDSGEPGSGSSPPETAIALPRQRRRGRDTKIGIAVSAFALVACGTAVLLFTAGGTARRPSIGPSADGAILVNPQTLRSDAFVHAGRAPASIAVGAGAVWVADSGDRTLARIDPVRRTTTDTLGIGGEVSSLVATRDMVYVTTPTATIGVDPSLVDVSTEARLQGQRSTPAPLTAQGQQVWIARLNVPVLRLAPSTLRPLRRLPVRGDGGQPAIGDGKLWVPVANPGGVAAVDLRTRRTVTISIPGSPAGVAVNRNAVWVVSEGPDRLWRLDPRTGTPQGETALGAAPHDVAVGGGFVWVIEQRPAQLLRLDQTGHITGQVRLAATPEGLAFGAGGVWLALRR